MATITAPDRLVLIVPRLDEEPARAMAWTDDVISYSGTPAFAAAYRAIANVLVGLGTAEMRIGIEEDYLSVQAHRDLSASAATGHVSRRIRTAQSTRIEVRSRLDALRTSARLSEEAWTSR